MAVIYQVRVYLFATLYPIRKIAENNASDIGINLRDYGKSRKEDMIRVKVIPLQKIQHYLIVKCIKGTQLLVFFKKGYFYIQAVEVMLLILGSGGGLTVKAVMIENPVHQAYAASV